MHCAGCIVVDSKFGVKRVCAFCAVRFYDLNKKPVTCPKCTHSFDPTTTFAPSVASQSGQSLSSAQKTIPETVIKVGVDEDELETGGDELSLDDIVADDVVNDDMAENDADNERLLHFEDDADLIDNDTTRLDDATKDEGEYMEDFPEVYEMGG